MDEFQRGTPYLYGAGASSPAVRNRVLRNTYWLLALSLIPTVVGAWVGVTTSFGLMIAQGGLLGMVLFLVGAFGLMYAIQRNRDSGLGVGLLLGFTFFMGLMLSPLLTYTLHFGNGASLIMLAFGGTAIIFFGMALIATTTRANLSGMGSWLTVGLLVIFVAMLANYFLHLPALMMTLSVLAVVLFSGFILFDVNRIVTGGETNYVMATLAIYLDLYNVFQNLLLLLGVFGGDRDS